MHHVLFLDDDSDLREVFCDLLPMLDAECVAVGSHRELVSTGERALASELAILDINLGPNEPSGIDSYGWLRDHGYRGKVVFLTGHAGSHPLVAEARELGGCSVFSKPITPEQLQSLLEEAAPPRR